MSPVHVAEHIGPEIVESVRTRLIDPGGRSPVPLWCLWPLLPAWTLTGVGWAGDDHSGVRASVAAFSGPAPVTGGPADLVLVAEEPGVGLGARLAGLTGPDPGKILADAITGSGLGVAGAHAKIRASGHPTPLWSVGFATDRSAYAGEARGMWLYAITWPASAGYLLAEDVVLYDLVDGVPPGLVYGAPSPYLHRKA